MGHFTANQDQERCAGGRSLRFPPRKSTTPGNPPSPLAVAWSRTQKTPEISQDIDDLLREQKR
jgi:hypothetical protein